MQEALKIFLEWFLGHLVIEEDYSNANQVGNKEEADSINTGFHCPKRSGIFAN